MDGKCLYIRVGSPFLCPWICFLPFVINNIYFSSHNLNQITHTLFFLLQATNPTINMDTIKQAGNFVSDKVNSLTADASHEANKNVAKDSNQSIGNRYVHPRL